MALLYWAHFLNLKAVRIFGDSLIVIGWIKGQTSINATNLSHRCYRIKALVQLFDQVDFAHIFRENNEDADMLSKRGIGCPERVLNIEESLGDNVSRYTHRLY